MLNPPLNLTVNSFLVVNLHQFNLKMNGKIVCVFFSKKCSRSVGWKFVLVLTMYPRTHTRTCSYTLETPLDNVFDISDSSSRSQTRCLWHILALLYPHPLPCASKWDTSTESKNHRPSPQTERFVCGAVIGKQIDGENIKSVVFTWLLFKMLILANRFC